MMIENKVCARPWVRRFTPEQELEISSRYIDERLSLKGMAKMYDCQFTTIRNVLLRNGVTPNSRGNRYREFSADDIKEIKRLYSNGLSQTAIASVYGAGQSTIGRVLISNGISANKRVATGERHGNWKGGSISLGGYRFVHLPADHPLRSIAQRGGYIAEHRLRMSEKLGRPLTPEETVHHINGDKLDNRQDNLELRQGKHGNGVVCRCADCGSQNIVFEETDGIMAD